MENLTIRINSVVAPLIEGHGDMLTECSRIRRLASKNVVELHFFDKYVRIIGAHNRKMLVPQKALKSGTALIGWMEQRIMKEWN